MSRLGEQPGTSDTHGRTGQGAWVAAICRAIHADRETVHRLLEAS